MADGRQAPAFREKCLHFITVNSGLVSLTEGWISLPASLRAEVAEILDAQANPR